MKLGKFKIYFFLIIFLLGTTLNVFGIDKIDSVPLVNLEELSPTFEEDKDVLERKEEQSGSSKSDENLGEEKLVKKSDKVYINITALDKNYCKDFSN